MWHGDDGYSINGEVQEEALIESLPDQFEKQLCWKLISSGTDEEIAESLKAALPQWRKYMEIDENPLNSVRFGYGTIKKLINYRIIPMLDILVWAEIKRFGSLTTDYLGYYIQTTTQKVKLDYPSRSRILTDLLLLNLARLILSGNFIFS